LSGKAVGLIQNSYRMVPEYLQAKSRIDAGLMQNNTLLIQSSYGVNAK